MSVPTYEEMEAKRQEMIASFREIATAMARCVKVIEDYTSLSPAHLNKNDRSGATVQPANLASIASGLSAAPNASAVATTPNAGAAEKKERKKKEKKPRDPNAPKRPPSAYILFQNQIRDDIRNSNPGMAYKDVLGIIAQKWKELPDSAKKVFETAYNDAQGQYRVDEEAYTKKNGGLPPVTTPAPAARAVSDSSDSSDDSDDSSDDDSTPAAPVIKSASKASKPPTTTAPLQVPPALSTLHAAVATPVPEAKKEKKRKTKEDESAVAATLDPTTEKKKKKKSKE